MGVNESRLSTDFIQIGTNYKLSNILAAVGLVQMDHIDELLNRRLELSRRYMELQQDLKNIVIPKTTIKGKHSRQSFCIHVKNRDEVMKKMRAEEIEVQIGTYALHMHKAFLPSKFCKIESDMHGSKHAFEHCLTLPLYHEMTRKDQDYVIQKLISCVE